jgi:hypothetical protein
MRCEARLYEKRWRRSPTKNNVARRTLTIRSEDTASGAKVSRSKSSLPHGLGATRICVVTTGDEDEDPVADSE